LLAFTLIARLHPIVRYCRYWYDFPLSGSWKCGTRKCKTEKYRT